MTSSDTNHLVLIVDDNDFNRDGLALYLRGYGYQTLEAGDAATAYDLAAAHCPDSAVVDEYSRQMATRMIALVEEALGKLAPADLRLSLIHI